MGRGSEEMPLSLRHFAVTNASPRPVPTITDLLSEVQTPVVMIVSEPPQPERLPSCPVLRPTRLELSAAYLACSPLRRE